MTQPTRPNSQWYPYAPFGSYYQLKDGSLLQRPMNKDGTMADEECEVDWDLGVSEEDLSILLEVIRELLVEKSEASR